MSGGGGGIGGAVGGAFGDALTGGIIGNGSKGRVGGLFDRAKDYSKKAINVQGDLASGMYHTSTGDFSQAKGDLGNAAVDSGVAKTPGQGQGENPVVPDAADLTPVSVDPNMLALRRQRMLASSYGRQQTVLSNPSTTLGASTGGTSLGM